MSASLRRIAPLTATNVVVALIVAKVLAVTLGPGGTGTYFLALALLGFVSSLATLGLGPVLTKVTAELSAAGRVRAAFPPLRRCLLLVGLLALAGGVLVVTVLSGATGFAEVDDPLVVLLIGLGIAPSAWILLLQGTLKGTRDFGAYVRVGFVTSLSNLALTALGASVAGVAGAVGGSVLVMVAGSLITARELRRTSDRPLPGSPASPAAEGDDPTVTHTGLRSLVSLGALALVAIMAATAGQAGSRLVIAHTVGLAGVGFFATAWAVSNRIPALVYQTFSAYLSPTLSALRRDWGRIHDEQDAALRLSLELVVPLLVLVSANASWIVPLLLSSSFSPMIPMLQVMLAGEVLSTLHWVLAGALFPTGRPLASAGFEWLWWALFGSGVATLPQVLGLEGVGLAYTAAYAVTVTALLAYERRGGALPLERSTLILVAAGAAIVAAPGVLARLTGDQPHLVAALGVGLAASWCAWLLFDRRTRPPVRPRTRWLGHAGEGGQRWPA
jgi:O-antigen/teichoic acid export membrane protein